jgi:tetratricopeptide (TPR) repeat protein
MRNIVMKFKQSPPIILVVLMALALLATAYSPSAAEKYNKEGNDAFTQQAYEEALAAYQTAQIKEPELAEPYYNAANALYRQGVYDAALEQLQIALSFADEESLAQNSFFNLGNSSYNAQDLDTAIAAYRESLLINPDDQDAKHNLELALQQQQQEQEQQQEQDKQQQQDDQQQQEPSENGDSQEEQKQDQSQNGEGQDPQDKQDQGEEQSKEGQQGEQEQESQQPAEDQSQDGKPQDGEETQEQQGQPQPGQEGSNQGGQPSQVPAPGQRMTKEQAEQLLASIAKNSETLQERLGQIFSVPWGDPVQDW